MFERFLKLRGSKSEAGQGAVAFLVAVVVLLTATFFLASTVELSNRIKRTLHSIETGATSIDSSASSIAQLVQTEAILDSILQTSKPLVPSLDEIIVLGTSIDGTATSINSSINAINSNVQGIGAEINDILSTTEVIASDIITINNLLDDTTDVANRIKRDTGLIDTSLHSANVSVCGIGGILAGILVASDPDETCL